MSKAARRRRALWLDPLALTDGFWKHTPAKLLLGAREDGGWVGIADQRHLITVAGSRAGKGTSVIIPNLLLHKGSVLVLDPKGENATETARARGLPESEGGFGDAVHVIDPFGAADVPQEYRSGFNPIAALDPAAPEFIDDCDAIADALIITEAGKENDFWSGSARLVLRGYVAWVAAWPAIGKELRNFETVYRLLTAAPKQFEKYLYKMVANPEIAAGVPYEAAAFLLGSEKRTRSNVMTVVHQQISFLASPRVREMFQAKGRSPDLREWKYGGVSIYLCLPAMRLQRHARFFRLFVSLLLLAVEKGSTDHQAERTEPAGTDDTR